MIRHRLISSAAVLAGVATLSGAVMTACTATSTTVADAGAPDAASDGTAPIDATADAPPDASPDQGNADGPVTIDGGTDSAGLPYYGAVVALSGTVNGNTSLFATAVFGPASELEAQLPEVTTLSCAGTKAGDCCYTPPPSATDGGVADAGGSTPPTAGDITFSSSSNATLITLTPSNGVYPFADNSANPSLVWTQGSGIEIMAQGADVHAFTDLLQTGPDVTGITPAIDVPFVIPLGQNWLPSWTPANQPSTTFNVKIKSSSANGPHGAISCMALDAQGSFIVDASLLAHFSAGDDLVVDFDRFTVNKVTTDNATVYLLGAVSQRGSGTAQ